MRKVISALGRPPARIAGILALAALFLSLLTLQQDELRRERERYHYLLTTNNWATSQLEFELERFLGRWTATPSGCPMSTATR